MEGVMFDEDLSSLPTAWLLFYGVFALDARTPSQIRLPVSMLSSSSDLLHPAYLDADNLPVTNWYARPSPLARFLFDTWFLFDTPLPLTPAPLAGYSRQSQRSCPAPTPPPQPPQRLTSY